MKKKKTNGALGSSFDSWLEEQDEGFQAEVIAGAMKRQFVNQVRQAMKKKGLGVNALQRMLGTGPSQIQRILDPEDVGISLKSIAKALASLGLSSSIGFKLTRANKKDEAA